MTPCPYEVPPATFPGKQIPSMYMSGKYMESIDKCVYIYIDQYICEYMYIRMLEIIGFM